MILTGRTCKVFNLNLNFLGKFSVEFNLEFCLEIEFQFKSAVPTCACSQIHYFPIPLYDVPAMYWLDIFRSC